jgi:hypothetical protein
MRIPTKNKAVNRSPVVINLQGCFNLLEKTIIMNNNNYDQNENSFCKQEDSAYCYTTETLAVRLNVSKKFIVTHRAKIPGAMKIGRIWRFDKTKVEKKLLSGSLL